MSSNIPRITSNQEIIDALSPVPDFKSRDDIKPWVTEKMEPRGINLVIERSDASKVVFKCKNIHRKSVTGTARGSKNSTGNLKGAKPARRVRNVPDDSCPFRLRVSYSVKHKVWAVNVIKFEHNPALCCNFGDHTSYGFSPSTTTPGSTKRSWSYTPASTVSPAFSSPANGSFTPASEVSAYNSYDYINMKKQRTSTSNISASYFDSPLYQEIDPLSENLSLLPEDLSDINHFYESSQDSNLINSLPLTNFDAPLDFNINTINNNNNNNNNNHNNNNAVQPSLQRQAPYEYQNQNNYMDLNNAMFSGFSKEQVQQLEFDEQKLQQSSFTQSKPTTNKTLFKAPNKPIKPKALKPKQKKQSVVSPKPQFSPSTQSILTEPLMMNHQQQQQPSPNNNSSYSNTIYNQNGMTADPLSLNLQSISEVSNEEEDDPLMYLLNVNSGNTNSGYSLEELENLDKAMGFDANDKLLMSMLQGM